MSHTIPRPSMMAIERVASDAADTDSLALYKLTNLVKLAAFACEARRTLEGIDGALTYQPKAKEAISQQVSYSNNWSEFEDVTAHVLQDVALQMEALNEAISNRPFELQKLDKQAGVDHE